MKTLVLGIGNVLRGDDAVGLRVVAELRSRLANRADLRSVERDLFEFEDLLADYDRLVVIDALPPGKSPGRLEVTAVNPTSIPDRKIHSLHDLDLLWQLRMIVGTFGGEILLIGIEAHSVEYSVALSPELAGRLPLLVEEAAETIECFMASSPAAL